MTDAAATHPLLTTYGGPHDGYKISVVIQHVTYYSERNDS